MHNDPVLKENQCDEPYRTGKSTGTECRVTVMKGGGMAGGMINMYGFPFRVIKMSCNQTKAIIVLVTSTVNILNNTVLYTLKWLMVNFTLCAFYHNKKKKSKGRCYKKVKIFKPHLKKKDLRISNIRWKKTASLSTNNLI